MDHSLPLISTLAIAFGLAIGFGYIAERCRFPALVGYLVAGIMAGKHTWGPVADMNVASQLMEVGVMLLMFGVGLHFSVTDLLRVKKLAVPGALLQMASATVLGAWMAHEFWQWPISSAVVFGLCLFCAAKHVSEASGVLFHLLVESNTLIHDAFTEGRKFFCKSYDGRCQQLRLGECACQGFANTGKSRVEFTGQS